MKPRVSDPRENARKQRKSVVRVGQLHTNALATVTAPTTKSLVLKRVLFVHQIQVLICCQKVTVMDIPNE